MKSRVSSPADGSTSTVRGPIPIPTTLQGDIGVRNISHINNEGRACYSTIKKCKKTVNKTFLKGSSVEKHCDDNQIHAKLNLKPGKCESPQCDMQILESHGDKCSSLVGTNNKDEIVNMLSCTKIANRNCDSRTSSIVNNMGSIRNRNTSGIVGLMANSGTQNLESSIVKLKNSTLNGSASTSVLRNNHSIINMRNSYKEKPNKYLSVSKISKKAHPSDKVFHTKTVSIAKEAISIDR